jgi:hypothetical protein
MKIIFKYSWIYDDQFRQGYKSVKSKPGFKYPSKDTIIKFKNELEALWKKDGAKILEELSNVTGLKWKEDKITCYIVGFAMPFSDPLTIPVYKDFEDAFDTLTHELVHQLFIQNEERGNDYWKYINENYKKLPFNTRIHIPVHAIHEAIFMTFFGKERLGKEIQLMSAYEEYKKSWETVKTEGYKNIIKELRVRFKVY